MKTFVTGAALAASALMAPAALAQQLPPAVVAVVDTDRIFLECNACRTAQTQLQTQAQQLQQRAQQLGQPLQTEGQALQTAINALGQTGQPDQALQTRIRNFQTQEQNAQRELATRQEQVQRNIAFVRQQIGQVINQVLPTAMSARGANMAIDRGVTLAINPAVDITNDVLAQVNQRLTTINVNAPAQAQQPPATPAPAQQQQQQQPPRPRGR